MSPINTALNTVRNTVRARAAASARTSVATVATKATVAAPAVDVSAYLKQNFQEPNYAAWGAAVSLPSTPIEPGRNIFGQLNPLVDVQEYMRINGILDSIDPGIADPNLDGPRVRSNDDPADDDQDDSELQAAPKQPPTSTDPPKTQVSRMSTYGAYDHMALEGDEETSTPSGYHLPWVTRRNDAGMLGKAWCDMEQSSASLSLLKFRYQYWGKAFMLANASKQVRKIIIKVGSIISHKAFTDPAVLPRFFRVQRIATVKLDSARHCVLLVLPLQRKPDLESSRARYQVFALAAEDQASIQALPLQGVHLEDLKFVRRDAVWRWKP
ncbi:hypothetical protein BZA05DRAFT_473655 [Tricharina praecox]|uniref:uncharacterized protein n=1 Tax=Tricharina praecox TaxID=43433 RepID=UPI002220FCF2|nr:uncharacterized protein BZA05DRAFT_473655 [Tricharina praecox]KAI5853623.1 hypothetical protein BZA05DRAFT_473655 [Tricharina praecox]